MRSVINHFDEQGIKAIVDQQFAIGEQIAEHGLVPILEPECTITAPDREKSEQLMTEEFKKHLATLDPEVKIMIKIAIPVNPHQYDELLNDPHVVRIVALSGGYSRDEANESSRSALESLLPSAVLCLLTSVLNRPKKNLMELSRLLSIPSSMHLLTRLPNN